MKDDPVFRREGEDLHVTIPVTVDEVFQGVEKRVPSIRGGVETITVSYALLQSNLCLNLVTVTKGTTMGRSGSELWKRYYG